MNNKAALLIENEKQIIDKGPLYSKMILCPLRYHGYKETSYTIGLCIAAIEYELTVYPEYIDILLDHLNNLKSKLKKIQDYE
jgi:hypothetical protein